MLHRILMLEVQAMEQRKVLHQFNAKRLKEIRKLRGTYDAFQSFWDELETVLKCKHPKSNEWERMDNDDVVLGEVWSQNIGEFYYKHTVHRFSYLYVESDGLAIAEHGHEEPVNNGNQRRKVKEWYIFPDGTISPCGKDEKHRLFNNYGKPIYVLSVKISGNGTH